MKSCPQCDQQLNAALEICPECGFVLTTLESGTIRSDDTTREIWVDQPDEDVSSSDSTIKQNSSDQDLTSAPTLQIPDDLGPEDNADVEDVDLEFDIDLSDDGIDLDDDDIDLSNDDALAPTLQSPKDLVIAASSDDDDLSSEQTSNADLNDQDAARSDQTVLIDPMQTMSRPLDDSPKLPSTVRPPTVRDPETIPGQRLPTIFNPQAAYEAAEEYSKGLQSLIPPRTIVQKEQVSDSSDYQILKRIGSGAYGTVFQAKQVPLERSVAIKLLQNSNVDAEYQQQIKNEFLREAQFTGRLEHPNIVPIHDIGLTVSPKGKVNPFYVMKEIRGQSWLGEIRKKTLKENLEVFKNVTNAIAFAHSQNILHCDLKPDNVMIGEFGEVLVVDWGQAVDLSVSETMRPGGTPAYISPEMAQYWIDTYLDHKSESPSQAEVGVRSDVYLLGALLFEIITGTAPHCKTTKEPPYEVIRKAAKNHVVDYPDDVNKDLMVIALRALRVTDDDHIETTSDMLAAINQYETRSLSIQLRQRAQEFLEQAKAKQDYDHFQRARFGFEEAIEKWDGNVDARHGLRNAKLSCAELALEDQNFDLGLDVLEGTDGDAEVELRKQLTGGKQTRDRRKKLVAGLAYGLAGTILLGALINGYMFNENVKSLAARDKAIEARDEARDEESRARTKTETLKIKSDQLEAEIEPLRAEIEPLKAEIEPLRAEIKKSKVEIKDSKRELAKSKVELKESKENLEKQRRESEAEKQTLQVNITNLKNQTDKLDEQKVELTKENNTLAGENQNLEGKVDKLNESSKLLLYKGDLTKISTDLQSGDYRDGRKSLAKYQNQQDWEIGRLNLLAHREIKSLYPIEPINSMSATADGKQLAIVFPDRIEIRSVDQIDQSGQAINRPNIAAVAISADGNQLFAGKPADLQDAAGQIEVFDLTQPGQPKSVRTLPAQSNSINSIQVSDSGNAMLSVGKTSALRQSSGQGLEEPLMVWVDGQKANVRLVLPDGAKLKFDSASFSSDGQQILLTNREGLPRDQHAHVFERNETGYQWIATSPITGISAATFISGPGNEVIAGIQNANTGGYSLARWRYAAGSPSSTDDSQDSNPVEIVAPLASKLIYLRQQGDFILATADDRQTTIWDWRNKESRKLKGQSRPADFGFVKPGERLETCKVVTAAIGEQPEILSINLADYQPEFQRRSIGWTPEDPPASITALFSPPPADRSVQAFGNDYGMASVLRGENPNPNLDADQNIVQWNISAWQYHVASDDFIFAQSAEDYLYQYDRASGALERVLTKLASYLDRGERIVDLQVSDNGRVALVKTNATLPKFLLWDLQQDQVIREVDYGKQDLFGTGSKKQLPKLALSRDGKWVIGAKVGVFGWPVDSGQLVRFSNNDSAAPRSIANSIVFVRNSQQVLVSWRNRIVQFDLARQQQVGAYSLPQISEAQVQDNLQDAIQSAGKIYVLADGNSARGGILLLSLKDQKQIAEFPQASFASFYATSDGVAAIAGGLDDESKIRLTTWDSTKNSPLALDLPALEDPILAQNFIGFERVSISPEHGILFQTTQRNRRSADRIWSSIAIDVTLPLNTKGQQSLGRLRVLSKPTIKRIVAQENQAATLASDQVMFWKLSETGVKPDGVLDVWATTMQLAPDSNTLAVSTDDNRCVLYDFSDRKKLGEFELQNSQGTVTAMAWQSDSQTIAIGRSTGTIEVLELNKDNFANSKSVTLKLNTPITGAISRIDYSNSGELLATVAEQGMTVLIRAIGDEAANIQDPTAELSEMVFRYEDERAVLVADISADGNRIVSGANTGRITIWNSEAPDQLSTDDVYYSSSERELLSLPNLHQSPISVVQFVDGRDHTMIYSAERNSGKNAFISWPSATSATTAEDTLRRD